MEKNSFTENEPTFATFSVKFALEPEFASIVWTIGDDNISSNSSFELIEDRRKECPAAHFYYSGNKTLYGNRYHNRKLLKCSVIVFPTIPLKSVQPAGRHFFFVAENDSVKILCVSEGNPTPCIYLEKKISNKIWNKTQVGPLLTGRDGESVFTIFTITKEDAITLRCVAENETGRNIFSVQVTIQLKKPVAVRIMTHLSENIFFRDTFSTSCVAQGHTVPQVYLENILNNNQWVQLQLTPTKTIQNSSINFTFNIMNAKHNPNDVYRCKAFNALGSNARSLNITIEISGKSKFFAKMPYGGWNRYL